MICTYFDLIKYSKSESLQTKLTFLPDPGSRMSDLGKTFRIPDPGCRILEKIFGSRIPDIGSPYYSDPDPNPDPNNKHNLLDSGSATDPRIRPSLQIFQFSS